MPISAIIEEELVKSVQGSSVQGIDGVWVNADVKVFLPLEVLRKCNDQAVSFSISQEDANILFEDVLRLRRLKPHLFNDWETGFIDSLDTKIKEGNILTPKQLAKVQKLHENFSIELSNLDKKVVDKTETVVDKEIDDIPF